MPNKIIPTDVSIVATYGQKTVIIPAYRLLELAGIKTVPDEIGIRVEQSGHAIMSTANPRPDVEPVITTRCADASDNITDMAETRFATMPAQDPKHAGRNVTVAKVRLIHKQKGV